MNIIKWLDVEFESSSGTTEQFNSFYRDVKRFIKDKANGEYEITMNKGHFYFSGFVKNINTGKFAYFSISDVRGFRNEWYNKMLVRTAKDNKDYTGGSNCFTKIEEIRIAMHTLTK